MIEQFIRGTLLDGNRVLIRVSDIKKVCENSKPEESEVDGNTLLLTVDGETYKLADDFDSIWRGIHSIYNP